MNTTGLALYSKTARESSAHVIGAYSTSFGLATALLQEPVRSHIRKIYALVRVADEVVDGPAAEAGATPAECRAMLDELEADTERALRTGFSANLVVHAFAESARALDIGTALTKPFFASMRADLEPVDFTEAELDTYVYGSAEVIGLMCLQAFLQHRSPTAMQRDTLERGARALGSAFQRVNFLRDLGEDADGRGRRYFPGLDPTNPDPAAVTEILDGIDRELAIAERALRGLPKGVQRAVRAALALYRELSAQLRAMPVHEIARHRASVPSMKKARIVGRVLITGRRA
ncbi:phytoene/squalene synthase family protein [Humidisolicoccus flavus]|uniref:phytoene/squalene synthase family protein n=1 Tax=Humidisolicoccus flavus TaxID=3111414 RepID=UPI00324FAD8A